MGFLKGPKLEKVIKRKPRSLRNQKKKNASRTSFLGWNSTVSIGELEEYAQEIVEWCQDPTVIKVMDFPTSKGIPPSKFRTWVDKNENLKNAFEIARYTIGSRNERKALIGEYNVGLVMGWMTTYDEDYRETLTFKSRLSNKREDEKQKVTVVLEAVASSPQVPKRTQEEDEGE